MFLDGFLTAVLSLVVGQSRGRRPTRAAEKHRRGPASHRRGRWRLPRGRWWLPHERWRWCRVHWGRCRRRRLPIDLHCRRSRRGGLHLLSFDESLAGGCLSDRNSD